MKPIQRPVHITDHAVKQYSNRSGTKDLKRAYQAVKDIAEHGEIVGNELSHKGWVAVFRNGSIVTVMRVRVLANSAKFKAKLRRHKLI